MLLTTLATSVMIIVRTSVWVLCVPLAQAVAAPPALALPAATSSRHTEIETERETHREL